MGNLECINEVGSWLARNETIGDVIFDKVVYTKRGKAFDYISTLDVVKCFEDEDTLVVVLGDETTKVLEIGMSLEQRVMNLESLVELLLKERNARVEHQKAIEDGINKEVERMKRPIMPNLMGFR